VYHGLARRYLTPPRFLMRPLLNGGTLGGPKGGALPTTLKTRKPVDKLLAEELDAFPVWEFATDEEGAPERDETWVRPVRTAHLRDLSGKLVGTFVTLANGTRQRAILGNVDLTNARSTQHFVTLSVESDGAWFHLARYHDLDYDVNGPAGLSAFLALDVEEVFPIAYDLSALVADPKANASGKLLAVPSERLSASELIALAVP
jgi:hypothetical protein